MLATAAALAAGYDLVRMLLPLGTRVRTHAYIDPSATATQT